MDSLTEILQGSQFSGLDWGIVGLYLIVSVAIGLIANRYVANMADYVVAGRGIRTALGIATLTGTELGLVTVMYNAQLGFHSGFSAFHIGVCAGIAAFFVGLTGFIIVPLRRHRVITIPEFYGKRFGRRTQILGGLILAFAGILNMGMFLRAGAMFIVGVTGLQNEAALNAVMVVLLGLVLFYTILGGMVSVVLTDYIQFVVLSFGLLLGTACAIHRLGLEGIFTAVEQLKGPGGFNPLRSDSGFGGEYVVWQFFAAGIVGSALWPTSVARALACESEQVVRRQFMWSSLSYLIRTIIPFFWGIAAFVFIMQVAPLKEAFFPSIEGVEAIDSLYAMPVFISRLLPVGLIGVLTAAMIAAFMSTHDSYLLCWSSVLTNDVVVPLIGSRLSERGRVRVARCFVLLIGVAILVVSLFFPLLENLWGYMVITGAIYTTGAFAVLVCGLYWKRASATGAVLAMLTGASAIFGLGGVQYGLLRYVFRCSMERTEALMNQFTGPRVGLTCVFVSLVAMIVGSLLWPDAGRREGRAG
ncbi:MAG TPA: sodium:solute symporter family protein [Candidatus Hydrogenedentes bacterium]|nr:sodium:solute symporter family protein [Candidatus Hydrogenedentota bacterium]